MNNEKVQNYINSKSTEDLAQELCAMLKQYRSASMEPDSTQSIPDLDMMCKVAEAISQQLKQ